MKITYEFVTGEVLKIEVPEYFGKISVAIDKDIHNNDRRETRRHNSLNALEDAGIQLADPTAEVAAIVYFYWILYIVIFALLYIFILAFIVFFQARKSAWYFFVQGLGWMGWGKGGRVAGLIRVIWLPG